jgi:hypothetical protein
MKREARFYSALILIAAAFTLAHRLSGTVQVEVRIPSQFGTDWADEVAA